METRGGSPRYIDGDDTGAASCVCTTSDLSRLREVNMNNNKCIRLLALLILAFSAPLAAQPAATELGSMPDETQFPKVEFIFEERVTLAPATVLGEAPSGHRQYIPITGGAIAGPKLNGRVIPGGWDYQNRHASGCFSMTADYFLEADDGTVIHILNESFSCGGAGPNEQRGFFRPRFEAPMDSAYAWMNSGAFVATLELDMAGNQGAAGGERPAPEIRIKVYQIK